MIREKIRVLIADDHPVVRRGLRQLLEEAGDIVVGGEAGSAAETLDQVRRNRWDVLVLDLDLPDRSGLEVMRDVKLVQESIRLFIEQREENIRDIFMKVAADEERTSASHAPAG